MLILAAHWVLPVPWWSKEAGSPPSVLSFMSGWATGFFVAPDGWLLTNRHVTAGCRRVSIGNATLSGLVADKILYPADMQLDLAAVHVALHPAAYLRLADLPWPSPGTETPIETVNRNIRAALTATGPSVSVIGYPGYDHDASPVRLAGELLGTATASDHRHWFQTVQAAIRPGSSGSPVIDGKGDVVGIVFDAIRSLPGGQSVAVRKAIMAALPATATQGLIVSAAMANAFMQAVDPAPGARIQAISGNPDAAIVRVFCFH